MGVCINVPKSTLLQTLKIQLVLSSCFIISSSVLMLIPLTVDWKISRNSAIFSLGPPNCIGIPPSFTPMTSENVLWNSFKFWPWSSIMLHSGLNWSTSQRHNCLLSRPHWISSRLPNPISLIAFFLSSDKLPTREQNRSGAHLVSKVNLSALIVFYSLLSEYASAHPILSYCFLWLALCSAESSLLVFLVCFLNCHKSNKD